MREFLMKKERKVGKGRSGRGRIGQVRRRGGGGVRVGGLATGWGAQEKGRGRIPVDIRHHTYFFILYIASLSANLLTKSIR